ncbi:hypothetical protein ASPSYDRAFT_164676 [Aspergillus sydowii CBS 593.65]|uniref:Amidase domain-containing protein n=1 Tax=Aspergillus sydowii CBS 593.65 TaxID=1036612 RepID=A0A1L9SZL7_9EURO|nr:uncharacterized protein ASPSYDRAFT_164676 [Aspergillus sydowii CBS 593.65]OJJ52521.1 hypothetical protein ASPSYDRAFT_164676 [Aspergillus sydowii CBS 593.65]
MASWASVNPLTATASELQAGLAAGKYNSSQLVDLYLEQIARHNDYLRAVIETTPVAVLHRQASQLDQERALGQTRGPLHGIPILLKDNIATHPDLGLGTTAGSFALLGSRPRRNSDILVRAGVIILGKANLSEFAYYRSEGIPSAWSARGGQGQSAYVRGGFRDDDSVGGHSNPGGSSSGSAVSVSAGFAPLSVGTETIGSLIIPADRAAVYTIKPTIGIVSQDGLIPVLPLCDAAGPMAKTASDLALLLDVLVEPSTTRIPQGGYIASATGSWGNIRIGVLSPGDWYLKDPPLKYVKEAEEQMTADIEAAYKRLGSIVSRLSRVSLISKTEANAGGEKDLNKLFDRDFARALEVYLASIDDSKVHTLLDLVEFNLVHSDLELPPRYDNQNGLLRALNSTLGDQEYDEILAFAREAGRELGIDKTLHDNEVDVIIGPGGSTMSYIAAAAGYPIASLPLSYLDYNGRPFGLAVIAPAHQDALLVQVMSAWEATFPPRKAPPMLSLPSMI